MKQVEKLQTPKALTDATALAAMDAVAANLPDRPSEQLHGRGIVMCAGGIRYFTCAWVCINMLRELGCTLPIEIWHLGEGEVNDGMRRLIEPLQARFVDGYTVRKRHPARILNGWELKSFAIMYSAFHEVMFLDADNVPVVDPSYLFEATEYKADGAVFWPDYGRLAKDRDIWRLTGVSYRNEPEFETGQILVDKSRCWKALCLTMWMNEYSDFWFRYIHGDKETFHMAWRKLGQPYAMPSRGIHTLRGTMCQHDFDGNRVFQHRNLLKWSLDHNKQVHGFQHEDRCLHHLQHLRHAYREMLGAPPFDPILARPLAGQTVSYNRVGHDKRTMELRSDGSVGNGSGRMERFWRIAQSGGTTCLELYGHDGLTARCYPDEDRPNEWKGKWLIHERMPIIITPHQCGVVLDNIRNRRNDPLVGVVLGLAKSEAYLGLLEHLPRLTLLILDGPSSPEERNNNAGRRSTPGIGHEEHAERFARLLEYTRPFADRCIIIHSLDHAVVSLLATNAIDFVFVNRACDNECLDRLLDKWLPLLKPNGFICGEQCAGNIRAFRSILHTCEYGGHVKAECGTDARWIILNIASHGKSSDGSKSRESSK